MLTARALLFPWVMSALMPALPQLRELDLAMASYALGNDAAFVALVRGLRPRLQVVFRRLGCARDLAEDLTQEALLRVHLGRASFKPGSPVQPWAVAIARNLYVSQARTLKARSAARTVRGELDDSASASRDDPEALLVGLESAARITRVLSRMSRRNREAFVLVRCEGLSLAAASERAGASVTALKLRAFRADKQLRAALGA